MVSAVATYKSLKTFRKLNNQPAAPDSTSKSWHTESAKAVLASFVTTPDGLAKEEAKDRLVKHGPNRLPETRTRGPLVRFFYQFHKVLI